MAKSVFFSFHYERDNWRASIVRNSNVTKNDSVFIDAADWEEVKKKSESEIQKWIIKQMKGTSTTLVLIGKETSTRDWVKFEIIESRKKGNNIIGIYIHNIKDKDKNVDSKGNADFGVIDTDENGNDLYFSDLYDTYDWIDDDGYNNLESWLDDLKVGKRKKNKHAVKIDSQKAPKKWGCKI